MAKPDGGPAFPKPIGHNGLTHHEEHECSPEQVGLSLRDYFAGQALAGFCATAPGTAGGWTWANDDIATEAYKLADAMLAEREK